MATDFELAVLKELGEIKGTAVASAARLDDLIAHIVIENKNCLDDRTQLNAKFTTMLGLQSAVAEIKDDMKDDKRWERIHNVAHYSLTPIVVFVHGLLRHFGINV